MTRIVDARGQVCPKPLIMTKKEFVRLTVGEELLVLIDNDTSKENVTRFLADNGAEVTVTDDNGVWRLSARKLAADLPHPDERAYCDPAASRPPHAICIRSDKMGTGADELGGILIRAFVNTIKDTQPHPGVIVFYNGGISLALKDSPVIDALRDLEKQNVTILVCGTCLDYYKKKTELGVGTVSNMYDISNALVSAGHVLYP